MRVFVTGATGFIGGHVARLLRERGDDVSALVRSPAKAAALEKLGCKIITGELSDQAAIAAGLAGCDALIHGAAVYEVGIPKSEHRRMYEANVLGTERVLSAALEAGTPKVVYISTIAVFGNTHGEVVDETYEHPAKSFTSYYEETKHEAHGAAKRLIAAGLLGGELTTMRGLMTTLAGVAGRKPPKRAIPSGVLRAVAPAGPVLGKLLGQPPNMRELVTSADGVTFWATSDKAIAELGYAPRELEAGLRDMLVAVGKLPAGAVGAQHQHSLRRSAPARRQ